MRDEEVEESSSRRGAFTALYRAHLPGVRAQIRAWVPASDVDEIVSATFVTAWQKFDQITPGSERAWLLGVARNHCRNRHRAVRRADALAVLVARTAQDVVDPNSDRPDPRELEPLLRALQRLSPEEQDLLALSAWQELTPAEIAAVLGIRQGTVRVRLHRARRRLEAEFERMRAEEGSA